jgi:hypothetical protein
VNKIFLTVLASTLFLHLFAQTNTDSLQMMSKINKQNAKRDRMNNMLRMEEEGDLIFNKHSIFGIRLATDGETRPERTPRFGRFGWHQFFLGGAL